MQALSVCGQELQQQCLSCLSPSLSVCLSVAPPKAPWCWAGIVGPALYINITFTWRIRITHLASCNCNWEQRRCYFCLCACYAATTQNFGWLLPHFLPSFLAFFPRFFYICVCPGQTFQLTWRQTKKKNEKQKKKRMERKKRWRCCSCSAGPRLKYSQRQHKSFKRTGTGLEKKKGRGVEWGWFWFWGRRTRWPPSSTRTSKLKVFEQTLSARSGDVAPTHSKGHAVRVHFVIVWMPCCCCWCCCCCCVCYCCYCSSSSVGSFSKFYATFNESFIFWYSLLPNVRPMPTFPHKHSHSHTIAALLYAVLLFNFFFALCRVFFRVHKMHYFLYLYVLPARRNPWPMSPRAPLSLL